MKHLLIGILSLSATIAAAKIPEILPELISY